MNHRATLLSILLPAGFFVVAVRYPGVAASGARVLRAAFAAVS
jgi:hypothetical protein